MVIMVSCQLRFAAGMDSKASHDDPDRPVMMILISCTAEVQRLPRGRCQGVGCRVRGWDGVGIISRSRPDPRL